MTTPTLSMRIFGETLRRQTLKHHRSKAAKKAWKTRRRMAKPSPAMHKILKFLNQSPLACFSIRYHGRYVYGVGLRYVNDDASESFTPYDTPRRPTLSTFRALKKRGWIELVRRRENGGTMGELPDGTKGIVIASYSLDYRISDKGRKAIS